MFSLILFFFITFSSYILGKKHQDLIRRFQNPGPAVGDFFMRTSNASNRNATSTTATSSVENGSTVEAANRLLALIQHLKLKSWETKVINSLYSYKSCEDVGDIAKQFTCGERKVACENIFE